ncbi:MAG: serine/threonine protein kinase [Polyangiaceae bacterium]|nr:serine/threonine protein kinase [Polyangiaceae bacterium]
MNDTVGEGTSSRLRPGERIGRYRLLAPLASGGMAEVWAAKPDGRLGLSRTVALKVVRAEYAADSEYTRMLIDEATVASAIHHPNVCDLLELDRHEELIFMVMEWIAGDSLAGLLHKGSEIAPLKYHLAARIVADACAGAHAAHEATDQEGAPLGIVHRDISPPNILLSLQGQVKVSDFGIAKARHQLHSRTKTGEVKGKFAYVPPEQIVGGAVDRRADVYALGCVLYVATLGLRPFGSGPQAMHKILEGEYRKPSELKPNYPKDLEAIIVTALAQDAENRFPTANAMRLALEEWMADREQVIGAPEIAHLVQRRLSTTKRAAIEELRKLSRASTLSLLARGLEIVEREQTPTAGSGLVAAPSGWSGRATGESEPTFVDHEGAIEGKRKSMRSIRPWTLQAGDPLAATLRPSKRSRSGHPRPSARPTRTSVKPRGPKLANRPPAAAQLPPPANAAPDRPSSTLLLLLGTIILLLLALIVLLAIR